MLNKKKILEHISSMSKDFDTAQHYTGISYVDFYNYLYKNLPDDTKKED